MLTAAEIRRKYIEFFVQNGHAHVASAPLVPPDDPTLLFTTAGMVQFKALYSGSVPLPYSRATTVQKCLRAGGKGSDLENVGKTLRHHTFFEMLGNFSFGDYFKREAVKWAWEFCTGEKWLGLPGERIFPTIFGKPDGKGGWIVDHEAEEIWKTETGVTNGIVRLNEKENFWGPAGETGACGPCSEIKFFMGTEEQLKAYQALSHSSDPADIAKMAHDIVEEGDLFLEIWNLVFPQYDQQLGGERLPLKNRGIDTGAGLERVTTSVQFFQSGGKVNSPYETDLLRPLIDAVSKVSGLPYPTLAGGEAAAEALKAKGLEPADVRLAMNACADHARTLTFTLAEGIVPSNEGRGYVLRRILRRAARFGKKIGLSEPFLWTLVKPVVEVMGGVYPEITKHPDVIEKTIRAEEERFTRTLNQGSEILEQMLAAKKPGESLSGEEAYRLYDTFGFPLDLTQEAAEERGVGIDMDAFNKALAEGKAKARASWKGGAGAGKWADLLRDIKDQKTTFCGYDALACEAKVIALVQGDQRVETLEEGQAGVVVLDRTPFYAESGGQVGDRGVLAGDDGAELFGVEDAQKTEDGLWLHFGEAREEVKVGQTLSAQVEESRRFDTMRNHSVTHLMQAALKRAIGQHVTQQGSAVAPDAMRFDFTNPEAVPAETLRQIEDEVNAMIRADLPVSTAVMSIEEARKTGAIAPFGEKYGATVRVVSMGDVSREFCGGTHVSRTGQIGLFVITGESSVASGIRRIEAMTGAGALAFVNHQREIVSRLSRRLSATPDALEERTGALQEEIKALRRQLDEVKAEQARAAMSKAAEGAQEVAGIKLIIQQMDGADHNALIQAWDAAKAHAPEKTVGVFAGVADGKVNMIVGATPDVAPARLNANDVLRETSALIGGKGGGKPILARGGGAAPEKLPEALAAVPGIIEKLIK